MLNIISILQMMLMLHHSMKLKIILHPLHSNPSVHNYRNWQTLSGYWDQQKVLKLLDNFVASSISIEDLVFHL